MRHSKLFCKTLRETPREAEAPSHQLLLRAGYIDQLAAGVFTFLPLGKRVLDNLKKIIKGKMEQEPLGGQEILMPALTPKENWQTTGRWDIFDSLFKLQGAGDKDYALAPTHEEIIFPLVKKIIFSYSELPTALFQIQTKFRNELRVKSGLLRTREFLMKDLYSFHATKEDLDSYYEKAADVYADVFEECGLRAKGKNKKTFKTLASGGSFSEYSHEYQTITSAGEDLIYICDKCSSAVNSEMKSEEEELCPNCGKKSTFVKEKAVEVGNIFKLGDKFSTPFNVNFKDKDGLEKPVLAGCYGIGIGRLMAAIVEINRDDRGIIWPASVAPFLIHIIQIEENNKVKKAAEKIYETFESAGVATLFDDRKGKSAGERFAQADLMGIPWRIVISEKTLSQYSVELKRRDSKEAKLVKVRQLRNEKFLKNLRAGGSN
jgi:prolyl-tRNA synthetase